MAHGNASKNWVTRSSLEERSLVSNLHPRAPVPSSFEMRPRGWKTLSGPRMKERRPQAAGACHSQGRLGSWEIRKTMELCVQVKYFIRNTVPFFLDVHNSVENFFSREISQESWRISEKGSLFNCVIELLKNLFGKCTVYELSLHPLKTLFYYTCWNIFGYPLCVSVNDSMYSINFIYMEIIKITFNCNSFCL